jgi:hypothetical protein
MPPFPPVIPMPRAPFGMFTFFVFPSRVLFRPHRVHVSVLTLPPRCLVRMRNVATSYPST